MGTCTSDPLGYISERYGQNVCKYVVSIKSEEYLDQVTPKIAQRVKQQFLHCSTNLNNQFDTKQKTIKDFYDDILTQALKESRIALEGVKKREKKNEEQIFGLTRIHQKFMKLRAAKDQKIQEYQDITFRRLEEKKRELKDDLISRRPQLPLLQQLPFWQREQAMFEAETRYAHEIKLREEELLSILQNSIYFGNLDDTIRKTVGIQQANDLVLAAETAFQRIKRSLTFSDNPRSCFI